MVMKTKGPERDFTNGLAARQHRSERLRASVSNTSVSVLVVVIREDVLIRFRVDGFAKLPRNPTQRLPQPL